MTTPLGGEMSEMMDSHMHQVDVSRHQIASFIRDMKNKDDLDSLCLLLRTISGSASDAPSVAAYFQGLAVATLEFKFGPCIACGDDHSTPAALIPEQAGPSKAAEGSLTPPAPGEDLKVGESGMLSVTQIENMQAYGLDDLREEDTGKLLGFICINCKAHYPSIKDRMMEPPGKENCSGCVHKEKWG